IAAEIRKEGLIDQFVKNRYSSWDSGIGAEIESGKASLASLEKFMLEKGDARPNESGRQEMLENIFNLYI
ncbi:MAG: xylose isomerase, partial [Pirellula sp.]